MHKKIELQPGEEERLIFMLGVGSREDAGYLVKKKYSDLKNVDSAFAELKKYWEEKNISSIQVLEIRNKSWSNIISEITKEFWDSTIQVMEKSGKAIQPLAEHYLKPLPESIASQTHEFLIQKYEEILKASLEYLKYLNLFKDYSIKFFSLISNAASIKIYDSFECENVKSDKPVSHFLRGILGGILFTIFRKEVTVYETKCIAKGDPYCEFEVKSKKVEEDSNQP